MNIKNARNPIIIVTTILWAALTVAGWNNDNYLYCLIMGNVIITGYLMIGCAKNGTLNKSFFFYPILPFFVIWTFGFIMAHVSSVKYAGMVPPLILGFHPSLFWIIITYWLGGVYTLAVGFARKKDMWMSPADWDAYKAKISELNKEM